MISFLNSGHILLIQLDTILTFVDLWNYLQFYLPKVSQRLENSSCNIKNDVYIMKNIMLSSVRMFFKLRNRRRNISLTESYPSQLTEHTTAHHTTLCWWKSSFWSLSRKTPILGCNKIYHALEVRLVGLVIWGMPYFVQLRAYQSDQFY